MDWLKKAPTSVVIAVIIVCGFLAAIVLAGYVALTLDGQNTTEYRQWIMSVGNLLQYPLLGTAVVASVSAAKSASKADDQTNGALVDRDDRIAALEAENARLKRNGPMP